jgi:hypothetical protein
MRRSISWCWHGHVVMSGDMWVCSLGYHGSQRSSKRVYLAAASVHGS